MALDAGRFEPRTVTLGPRSENYQYQVYTGLKEGERVVTSGQFMLDSESQLREAIQKMQRGSGAPAAELTSAKDRAAVALTNLTTAPSEAETTTYICPMPEHVAIKYNHPGKCPICGMTLVPVSEATLSKLQPGGKVLFYTCPMPEHSAVHVAEPGKCPKCGMTLIPVMRAPPPDSAESSAIPSTLYTCPMAAHADVVSERPGKCPKCDMELVLTSSVAHGKIAEENWRKQHAAPASTNGAVTLPR